MSGAAGADSVVFRIGEAAEIVGVEPHVLRYWESEFDVEPRRSANGQRLYRQLEIELFLKIRRLLHEEKFTIAGARKTLLEGAPAVAGGEIDAARVRDALERIRAARARVASLRARTARLGITEGRNG